MTQPGNFSLVGEGLNVGRDPRRAGHRRLPGRRARTRSRGGTIKRVDRRRLRRAYVDLELEALAMMKRE